MLKCILKAIGARDDDREMAVGAGDARAKTRQADVDAEGGDGTCCERIRREAQMTFPSPFPGTSYSPERK